MCIPCTPPRCEVAVSTCLACSGSPPESHASVPQVSIPGSGMESHHTTLDSHDTKNVWITVLCISSCNGNNYTVFMKVYCSYVVQTSSGMKTRQAVTMRPV